ncbi:hypothetical protein N665_0204s0038 [Sinapis alba]|nr:hypothetical protein N665_0204s0038 [Sinapis alba]
MMVIACSGIEALSVFRSSWIQLNLFPVRSGGSPIKFSGDNFQSGVSWVTYWQTSNTCSLYVLSSTRGRASLTCSPTSFGLPFILAYYFGPCYIFSFPFVGLLSILSV